MKSDTSMMPAMSKSAQEKEDFTKNFGEATQVAQAKDMKMGDGMLEAAKKALQSREYKLHVEEMKSLGEKPKTPEEWAKEKQPAKA